MEETESIGLATASALYNTPAHLPSVILMRILHLLASPVFSGPAENVALLAVAQRELGHEVTVAVDRKRPGLKDEEPVVPRLETLGVLDDGGLELSVKSSPWAIVGDIRRLRQRSVEIVHSHFSHDHWVARWGLPKGAALVRSFHAERSLNSKAPRSDARTVPSVPLLNRVSAPRDVLPPLLANAFVPAADRQARKRELAIAGNPIIAMVSHFQPSRRHEWGLSTFAQLLKEQPHARLLLVGDGPLAPALRSQAQLLGISERVTFAGYQAGDAFVHHLQSADEVWILGLGNDASGRMARQARACGARVVAVNEGGLAENAHVLLEDLAPEKILAARLSPDRILETPLSNRQIAQRMLDLYARATASRRGGA